MFNFLQQINKRHELKKVFSLFFPIMGSQLAIQAMSVTDVAMVGNYHTNDLIAVGLATGIAFPIVIFAMGILMGVSILSSYAFGKKNYEEIINLTHQGFYISIILIILWSTLLYFNYPIINFFMKDTSVIQENPQVLDILSSYLKILALGYPGLVLFILLRTFFESQGKTIPVTIITFLAIPLNVVFNYLFIYGEFGFPELGGAGTAIATSGSYYSMLLFAIIYIKFQNKKINLFQRFKKIDFKIIKNILNLGFPISINILLEVLIFAYLSFFAIEFGKNHVAATQVAVNFSGLMYQVPYALSVAFTIRVSHVIGSSSSHDYRSIHVSYFFIILSVIIGSFQAFMTYLSIPIITSLYTPDTTVQILTTYLLKVVSVFFLADSLFVALNGILKAFKDTRFPMYIVGVCYWLIGVPFGYHYSHTLFFKDQPMNAYFWGLAISMTLGSMIFFLRFRYINRKKI